MATKPNDPLAPSDGELFVGYDPDTLDVVINHPKLTTDEHGAGWISFTPEQARHLAALLHRKAAEVEYIKRARKL